MMNSRRETGGKEEMKGEGGEIKEVGERGSLIKYRKKGN